MADIAQLKDWCDKARKLLSKVEKEGRNKMDRRNQEVAELLGKMEKIPALKTQFDKLKGRYEVAAENAQAAQASKTLTDDQKKKAVQVVSLELRALKAEIRMALGSADPNASPTVRKAMLEAARHKPVYEDKRKRIEEAILEIGALPGTATQVKKLQALLTAGKTAEPDYEAAYTALEGLSGTVKEAKTAAEKFAKTAGDKDFQGLLATTRKTVSDYENVAGIADAGTIAVARGTIASSIKSIDVEPGKKVEAEKKASEALQKIIDDLTQKKKDAESLALLIKPLHKEMNTKMGDLRVWTSVDVLSPLLSEWRIAEALAGGQQFAGAKGAYDDLKNKMDGIYDTHKKAFDAWTKLDGELTKDHEPTLNEAASVTEISTLANKTLSVIRVARVKFASAHEFSKATDLVTQKVLGEMPEFTRLVKLAAKNRIKGQKQEALEPKFTDVDLKLDAQAAKARARFKKAVGDLDARLKSLHLAKGDRSGFDKEARPQQEAWSKLDEAYTVAEPDKKAEAAEKMTTEAGVLAGEVDKVRVKVEELLKDPSSKDFKANAESRTKTDAGAEFKKARATVDKAIDYLDEYGIADTHAAMKANPSMSSLRAEYKKLTEAADKGTYQTKELEELAKSCEEKRTALDLAVQQETQKAEVTAKKLLEVIEQLQKENKDYPGYFDTLRGKVSDCLGMTRSTIFSVVETGVKNLATAGQELVQAGKTLRSATPSDKNFKRVALEVEALKKRLSASDLSEYQKANQKALQTRLTKVLPDMLRQLSPEKALEELAKFAGDVKTAEDTAKRAKESSTKLKENVATAEKALEALKKSASTLFASLKKKLDAAGKADKGSESTALVEVATITLLVREATTGTGAKDSLDKMEDKAKRDSFEAKRVEKAFEAAKDVFQKTLQRNADAAKKETPAKLVDSDLYDQIAAIYKEAEKLGKAGDYDGGTSKLSQAAQLAERFIQNPFNAASTSRKELVGLNAAWKQAVSQYLNQITGLISTIKDQAKTETDVDATAAETALKPTLSLFDAAAFDGTVGVLSVEMKDPKEIMDRRQRKESALATARRYLAILKNNALLKHVIGNPVNNLTVTGLRSVLNSLSTTLLAA